MIALIDGDIFTRRYTAAAEFEEFEMSDGETVRTMKGSKKYIEENPGVTIIDSRREISPVEFVKHSINLALLDIMNVTEAQDRIIYLGERGGKNFRHTIYPPYKANRKDKKKPVHYEEIYEWLLDKHDAATCYDIEADDALGIAASQYAHWTICSNDKDMLQIPGVHYNFVKKELLHTSQLVGDKLLFKQVLMGDSVDNIPGLPKVGEKTAQKLIKDCTSFQEAYDVCVMAYKGCYGKDWYDPFMLNGSLIYLLRKKGDSFYEYLTRNGVGEHAKTGTED